MAFHLKARAANKQFCLKSNKVCANKPLQKLSAFSTPTGRVWPSLPGHDGDENVMSCCSAEELLWGNCVQW